MSRFKYPRTPHLPWSLGATNDDKKLQNCNHFYGHEIVVTEKFDGENCTLYSDGLHARSLDSRGHSSRDWVKRYQSEVGWTIPQGWRVCGENLFAKHSIHYTQLKSFFLVFGVYTAENVALSWDDTVKFADERGMHTVTTLYQGTWDEKKLRALQLDTTQQEGFVVRLADAFHYDNFANSVAKWVRKNHVQTDTHWMHQEIQMNQLV